MRGSIFFFLLALAGCTEPFLFTGTPPIVLGHGGNGIHSLYPSNSMESVQRALASGAHGVELDVQMTADFELVVYHDTRLESRTTGEGAVFELELEEVLQANYLHPLYAGYNVVSLRQMMRIIEPQHWISLDVKIRNPQPDSIWFNELAYSISDLAEEFGLDDNLIVESRSVQFLQRLIEVAPLLSTQVNDAPQAAIETAVNIGADGIGTELYLMTEEDFQDIGASGLFLTLFSVSTKQDNRDALTYMPHFIQTDRIADLLNLLD